MKRRQFLKLSLLAPVFLKMSCTGGSKPDLLYKKAGEKSFEFLEISGSYKNIGFQTGKIFGSNIKHIIENRPEWINFLQKAIKSSAGKKFSEELYTVTSRHFPQLIEEINGISEGSGISFDLIWAMNIQSELDAIKYQCEGCSTLFFDNKAECRLFHNEDGNFACSDKMYILKIHPPSGTSFISLAYPGILPGVGPNINSKGIIQTCNYIGTAKPEIGIPRYLLGRAVLEARTFAEAVQLAEFIPRAYNWHHNLCDISGRKYLSLETLNDGTFNEVYPEKIFAHTNHLTGNNTRNSESAYSSPKLPETIKRLKTLNELISDNGYEHLSQNPGLALQWLSSHKNDPDSICRHRNAVSENVTIATADFDFNKATMRIYKGNPCTAVPKELFEDYCF